ncbi:MFS general substrate transporter [Penicillium hispanicum]|uniref:MFS general substrate transporter n=1 Tax=Penicillium hispanicum TaxID=1080232 RepID=UPI0025423EE6|nr:MFS general substrate transporter [Penicillium hispanicum]KAJ5578744.1 MFS general substrate transporter [Penicillium hispanicum]
MKGDSVELNESSHFSTAEVADTETMIEAGEGPSTQYLEGARLYALTATLCLCLFLTNLEIPIVSTSLVSIAGELGALEKIYWITTAYMLGYAGVLVLSAKFSDILGRKTCLLAAVIIFVIFSAACGAAQTMNQLIVFRALQGLGGAGNYAICTIIVVEMVPPEKFAKYTGGVATVFVFSLLFGPLFGGAITQHSTWRWIFLLNIPPGVVAAVALLLLLPNGFPHHNLRRKSSSFRESFQKAFRRIDILGSFLLVAATVLLVTGLDEADEQFAWRSGFTIAVLTISGVLWILFVVWERWVTLNTGTREPVFPWRFFQNRVWMAMLLSVQSSPILTFLFPGPFVRFEIVNQLSSFDAAVRLIPFTIASPVASILAPTIGKAFRIPLIYLLMVGSAIQIVAFVLLGTVPEQQSIPARQYGYQVLAGFGCGINTPLLTLMTPFATEKRDHAVAMGAIAQFRTMGGSIGLAIVTAIQHSYLRSNLRHFLGGDMVEALLQSTSTLAKLPIGTQDLVRETYAASYNLQMKILAAMAGVQLLTSMMMWRKDPIVAA